MKRIGFLLFLALFAASTLSFDWPQQLSGEDDFSQLFGRERHGALSSGIVFAQENNVYAGETSTLLMVMGESENISSFDSTLGNTVITMNYDNIMNVYGNLSSISLQPAMSTVKEGQSIGMGGKSGWKDGHSGSEFQIMDVQSRVALNPFEILPKYETDVKVSLRSLVLVSSNDKVYDFFSGQNVPPGKYMLYGNIAPRLPITKTEISVNGSKVETLKFDRLIDEDGRLAVSGSANRTFETMIYDGKQFLGELTLSRGRSAIRISINDISGTKTGFNYTIEVH